MQKVDLPKGSIANYRKLFGSLPAPASQSLVGRYRAEFVGPAWLRWLAPRGLVLAGLGGWWGKELNQLHGNNLVLRRGRLQNTMPVTLQTQASAQDGQPCVAVLYSQQSPWPWPYVVDELRVLGPSTLLGLTYLNLPGWQKQALPFVLHHEPV